MKKAARLAPPSAATMIGPHFAVRSQFLRASVGLAPPPEQLLERRLPALKGRVLAHLRKDAHAVQAGYGIGQECRQQDESREDGQAEAVGEVHEEGQHRDPDADQDGQHGRAAQCRRDFERRQVDEIQARQPDQQQQDGRPGGLQLLQRGCRRAAAFDRGTTRSISTCRGALSEHCCCDEAEYEVVEQAAPDGEAIEERTQHHPRQHPDTDESHGDPAQGDQLDVGGLLEVVAALFIRHMLESRVLACGNARKAHKRQHPRQVNHEPRIGGIVALGQAILADLQHHPRAELGRQHPEQEHEGIEGRPMAQPDLPGVKVEEDGLRLRCVEEQEQPPSDAQDADAAEPQTVERRA